MAHALPLPARGRWPGFAWPAIALVVTVAVGVPVEAVVYPDDLGAATADLAVAVAFVVCGAAIWTRLREGDLTGPLLMATGAAWLAGGLADELVLLHRGPLVQLLVTAPGARPHGWFEWVLVGGGYALALTPDVAREDGATLVLVLALPGVAIWRCIRARGLQRRARVVPAAAAVAIALVLGVGAFAEPSDAETVLWFYEAALVGTAVAFFVDVRWGGWAQSAVTSLVIDLGDARSGSLTAVLAQAVGDPSLVVGYVRDGGQYADESGLALELPEPDSGRAITGVESNGAPAAVLVHDPAALRSPQLADAVTAAVRLALDNARLRDDIRARLRDVEASRGRLLNARDAERSRLEHRLQAAVDGRLEAAARALAAIEAEAGEPVAALPDELERTRASLRSFAAGLHSPELERGGLAVALPVLAAQAPLPVAVEVDCDRLDPSLEVAAWFVCSEGLANVAKHSGAAGAEVSATHSAGSLVVTVDDAGRGGADPSAGRGLRGLAARVEAVGGRLEVGARPGGGTRLRAKFPVKDCD